MAIQNTKQISAISYRFHLGNSILKTGSTHMNHVCHGEWIPLALGSVIGPVSFLPPVEW